MLSVLVAGMSLFIGDISGTALEEIELRTTVSAKRFELYLGETIVWNVFCSAHDSQISCTYDPRTSTVAPMKLLINGPRGIVVAEEQRFTVERELEKWLVRTSSSAELIAEIYVAPALEASFAPELSQPMRRVLAGLALVLYVFEANGIEPSPAAPTYPGLERVGLNPVLGLGYLLNSPFPSKNTVSRKNNHQFLLRVGLAFLDSFELTFDFAVGGRTLDASVIERSLGVPGSIGTLELNTFSGENSTLSGASGISSTLALKYNFASEGLRIYAGIFAGIRYEPMVFSSPDLLRACNGDGSSICRAASGYGIEAPNTAYTFGPLFGVVQPLVTTFAYSFEMFLETRAHATFWVEPQLLFDGDVVPEALLAYERWQELDYGSPVFDISVMAGVAIRFSL